ncbi:hypothetical protein TorRG33x02_306450 [Trema orientale]|uniref:Uncharacterized protein n=1 Tax=Trema orientale TaxID=63057 RepID=A0A2P5BW96_TREOI|nr:hypothetical protein TorRG33x02_306450 [Trema orientale]
MPDPEDVPPSSDLHVVLRVDGAPEKVFEGGQASDPFVDARVLRGHLPDSDLTVLMTREDPLTRNNDGFNQPTIAFEPGKLLHVLPDTNILAIGSSIEKVSGHG